MGQGGCRSNGAEDLNPTLAPSQRPPGSVTYVISLLAAVATRHPSGGRGARHSSMADSSSAFATSLTSLVRRTTGIDATVQQLLEERRELKSTWDEVDAAVAAAERLQWVPRSEVKRWLERAEDVLKEVDEFEDRYWNWREQLHGLLGCLLSCGCPLLCGYALGARASDLLLQVQDLGGQKIDVGEVARPPPLLAVEKVPAAPVTNQMIGYRQTLEDIWDSLRDDAVGVIGLCGMGGTGKSTLLTIINNDASDLVGFGLVIWIDMSKDVSLDRLRRKIAKRCCLLQSDAASDDIHLPQQLFNFLSGKRYLLMLSDMWHPVDLAEVGVPVPDAANKSKIVFTTRSDYVYVEMEADKRILVDPLDAGDSWELFCSRVPAEVLDADPSIRQHAEGLVAACGGLPKAISRIGRTMGTKKRASEWEWARRIILESPMELRGMGEVINLLKESYDHLSSDLAKRCFVHCSSEAFRDRAEIGVEDLVDSMIKGGLVGEEERGKGYVVIEDLKALYLLLQTSDDGVDQLIKIHPMVRVMALQIAKESRGSRTISSE